MKTADFLAEIIRRYDLKDRFGGPGTQYSVWKHMNSKYGWAHATVVNYYSGKGFPGEQQALEIANELELNPGYVLACIEAERTKNADVRAAWEAAAEQLKKLPAKKTATKRGTGKSTKVAGVILSLGIVWGVMGIPTDALQAADSAGIFRTAEFTAAGGGIGRCVLCKIIHLSIIALCLVLSALSLRQAIDRGRVRSTNNNNNKDDAVQGNFNGRDITGLPDPGRIITGTGSNIYRLFPPNLPAPRVSRNTTGRSASVTQISRRVYPRMAGLSDPGRHTDHTRRHDTSSQPLGGLELCPATAARTDRSTTTQDIRAGSQHSKKPDQGLSFRSLSCSPGAGIPSVSLPRSTSSTPSHAAADQRPAALGRRSPAEPRRYRDQLDTARFLRNSGKIDRIGLRKRRDLDRPQAVASPLSQVFAILAIAASMLFTDPAAAAGVAFGTVSHHERGSDYDETNPGLCLQSGFSWYVTGCLYEDSHSQAAGVIAGGGRLSIMPWLHIGAGAGLQFHQAINEAGQQYIDPDPVIAGTLMIGTDRIGAEFITTPEHETKHETIPAVTWLQLRIGF